MERPYQIVVWGATGFVGRLVCEHISRDYQASLSTGSRTPVVVQGCVKVLTSCMTNVQGKFKWAMVARNKARLEGVHQEMVKINPKVKVWAPRSLMW